MTIFTVINTEYAQYVDLSTKAEFNRTQLRKEYHWDGTDKFAYPVNGEGAALTLPMNTVDTTGKIFVVSVDEGSRVHLRVTNPIEQVREYSDNQYNEDAFLVLL